MDASNIKCEYLNGAYSELANLLGIIVEIIAYIVYVIKKKRPLEMNNDDTDIPNSEDNNESKRFCKNRVCW